jgi:hypothetical protein
MLASAATSTGLWVQVQTSQARTAFGFCFKAWKRTRSTALMIPNTFPAESITGKEDSFRDFISASTFSIEEAAHPRPIEDAPIVYGKFTGADVRLVDPPIADLYPELPAGITKKSMDRRDRDSQVSCYLDRRAAIPRNIGKRPQQ